MNIGNALLRDEPTPAETDNYQAFVTSCRLATKNTRKVFVTLTGTEVRDYLNGIDIYGKAVVDEVLPIIEAGFRAHMYPFSDHPDWKTSPVFAGFDPDMVEASNDYIPTTLAQKLIHILMYDRILPIDSSEIHFTYDYVHNHMAFSDAEFENDYPNTITMRCNGLDPVYANNCNMIRRCNTEIKPCHVLFNRKTGTGIVTSDIMLKWARTCFSNEPEFMFLQKMLTDLSQLREHDMSTSILLGYWDDDLAERFLQNQVLAVEDPVGDDIIPTLDQVKRTFTLFSWLSQRMMACFLELSGEDYKVITDGPITIKNEVIRIVPPQLNA